MRALNTVTGTVRAEDVRWICPHEHLFLDMTHEAVEPKTEAEKSLFYGDVRMRDLGALRRNPYVVRTNLILEDMDIALAEASFLEKYNCNLLVDVTTVGLGRDLPKLREFSGRSGLHVIAGTGLFVHDSLPECCNGLQAEQIASWMLEEIEKGDPATGIKPGVIGEIGVSEVIYPVERESLLAAAAVSRKTDLPVYLHTFPWSGAGLEAVELLLENGAAPENICICHLDVSFQDAYIRGALARGVYVEFDNFGKEFYFEPQEGAFAGGPFETDVARVRKIKELVEAGFTNQILLANDLCLKASLHHYGGWGYDHVFGNIIPMMKMENIPQSAIRQIIEENPKRFLFRC